MTTTTLRFKVTCEWKGQTAEFTVDAPSKDEACDIAWSRCKARTGFPKSAVARVAYVGPTPSAN